MKALVLGCGSIGFRHIGHLLQLGVSDVEAADPRPEACQRARAAYGIQVTTDPDQAFGRQPDVVLICTPAATHLPLALRALEAGAHLFVEKPLSTRLEGVSPLAEKVRSDGRIVQVGYNLRYHPALKAAKAIIDSGRLGSIFSGHAEFGLYLPIWWPGRDYRVSYMADPNLGGGLLLDASHEIDLMIWLLGKVREVLAYGGHFSGLDIPGPDAVKILLRMASGALVSLDLDCLQPVYTRGWRLTGEGTALRWRCLKGRTDQTLGELEVFEKGAVDFESVPLEGNPQDTYLEELREFLDSVRSGRPSGLGLEGGIEVLKVVEAIQESMRTGSSVGVA